MKKILCILAVLVLVCALSAAASAEPPAECYACGNKEFKTELCTEDHIDVSCLTDGRECYICANETCLTHNYVTIPQYGEHSWNAGEIIQQPTYTSKGITKYTCTRCSETENRDDIPMLIHVNGLALNKSSVDMYVGDTLTLTVSIAPENASDKNIDWISSNSAIASVSNGVVTANGVGGPITIRAVTKDGTSISATCSITVYQSDRPIPTATPTTAPSLFSSVYAYTNPAGYAVILGDGTYPTGSNVTLTVTNIMPGYIFTGWSLSNGATSLNPIFNFTIDRDVTAVANFARSTAKYTITYLPNDANETTIYTQEKYSGIPVTVKSAIYTKNGYVQSGWMTSDGRIFNFGSQYVLDSNLDLYPVWSTPGQHTLKVTFNADGKGKVHTGNTTVENGMTFKVKDNESATFHFDTVGDIYPYNIRLNGVSKGSYSTYTVRGQAYDQELYVEFGSIYDHPKTGDSDDIIIYSMLALTSLTALTGMMLSRRKKNGRN